MSRQKIVPYLYYEDGVAAMDYLCKTFGFEEREKVMRDDGTFMHGEVGYQDNVGTIMGYLEGFRNLYPIGRGGMFRYYNMDHALRSGIEAAGAVVENALPPTRGLTEPVVA